MFWRKSDNYDVDDLELQAEYSAQVQRLEQKVI